MPNWSHSRLEVAGETHDVEKFYNENRRVKSGEFTETELDFGRAVPMPAKADWYHWCIANWGTKWNASDVGQCTTKYMYGYAISEYHFDTAWCPPEAWFNTVIKKYPNLDFNLSTHEEAWQFWSIVVAKKGEVQMDYYTEKIQDIFPEFVDGLEWGTDEADSQFEHLMNNWNALCEGHSLTKQYTT
jgi:hypothetical protein